MLNVEKRYNAYKKQVINLKEGEEFCRKCNGKGRVPVRDNIMLTCSLCNGDGKYDWIEKITGKQVKYVGYYTSADAEL